MMKREEKTPAWVKRIMVIAQIAMLVYTAVDTNRPELIMLGMLTVVIALI